MSFTVGNRYQTIGPALKGGMGAVYKATDLKLGRTVALKRHHASSTQIIKDQTLREARLLAEVDHPSIVKIHDIIFSDKDIWQVSEWIDGITLASLPIPIPDHLCMYVFSELHDALVSLHKIGVIHRDIKPSNIMVDTKGQIKLIDFDIAFHPEHSTGQTLAMTLQYTDPKVIAGEAATPESDFYSLALVILELLSGEKVWPASSPIALYRQIQKHSQRRLQDLSNSHYPPLSQTLKLYFSRLAKTESTGKKQGQALKIREIIRQENLQSECENAFAGYVSKGKPLPKNCATALVEHGRNAIGSKKTPSAERNAWLSFAAIPNTPNPLALKQAILGLLFFLGLCPVLMTAHTKRHPRPTPIIASLEVPFETKRTMINALKSLPKKSQITPPSAPKLAPSTPTEKTIIKQFSLLLNSNAWADVYANGKKIGRLPRAQAFIFKKPTVTLQFKSPLIESEIRTFQLNSAKTMAMKLDFKKRQHHFAVDLNQGEELQIDGANGQQDKDGLFSVSYGPHRFTINTNGKKSAHEKIIITPSSPKNLRIKRL